MEKLSPVKARLIMSLADIDIKCCTTTYMALQHSVAKSTISRAADWCEEYGLLQRQQGKYMCLTEYGKRVAANLVRGKKIADAWCRMYSISPQNAEEDAEALYLGCSEELLERMRQETLLFSAKEQMHKAHRPGSYQLCRALPDGEYHLDFVFYKSGENAEVNVSMANEGFIHPLKLKVHDSDGSIALTSSAIQCMSRKTGRYMAGEARSIRYIKDGISYEAIKTGNEFVLPFDIFRLISISAFSCHAVAEICIKSTAEEMHMPESRVRLLLIL